jgi:hypothetical protein
LTVGGRVGRAIDGSVGASVGELTGDILTVGDDLLSEACCQEFDDVATATPTTTAIIAKTATTPTITTSCFAEHMDLLDVVVLSLLVPALSSLGLSLLLSTTKTWPTTIFS